MRLENSLHLFALSLSADVSSETLLGELEASFVLGDLQQLETALLVRREAGDFTNHLAHEFDVLVLHALSARGLDRGLEKTGDTKKSKAKSQEISHYMYITCT